jgi:hypothetical protein
METWLAFSFYLPVQVQVWAGALARQARLTCSIRVYP